MRHIDCIAAFTVNLDTAWLKCTASRSIAFGTLIFCPSPCSSWTPFNAFFWACFGGCERQACECFFTVSSHSLDSSSWLLSRNHEDLIAVFFKREQKPHHARRTAHCCFGFGCPGCKFTVKQSFITSRPKVFFDIVERTQKRQTWKVTGIPCVLWNLECGGYVNKYVISSSKKLFIWTITNIMTSDINKNVRSMMWNRHRASRRFVIHYVIGL